MTDSTMLDRIRPHLHRAISAIALLLTSLVCFFLAFIAILQAARSVVGAICWSVGEDTANMFCDRSGDPSMQDFYLLPISLCVAIVFLIFFIRRAKQRTIIWRLGWIILLVLLIITLSAVTTAIYLPLEKSEEANRPKIAISVASLPSALVTKGETITLDLLIANKDTRALTLRIQRGCMGFVLEKYNDGTYKLYPSKGHACSAMAYETIVLKPSESTVNRVEYPISTAIPSGHLSIEIHESAWFEHRIGIATTNVELTVK